MNQTGRKMMMLSVIAYSKPLTTSTDALRGEEITTWFSQLYIR
jgi:chromosome segregation and condensation protein ScpB